MTGMTAAELAARLASRHATRSDVADWLADVLKATPPAQFNVCT